MDPMQPHQPMPVSPPPRPPGRSWMVPVGVGALIGSLVGVGLWMVLSGDDGGDEGEPRETASAGVTTTGTPETATAPQGPGTGPSLTGTWEGTYECSQGVTGMTLTIVDVEGDIDAVWEFYEVAENPGVPAGAYALEGALADGGLSLEGTEWIEQPEGYAMSTLQADVAGGDVQQLEGTVGGEGCSSFSLDRTTTVPWYVGAWQGGYDCGQGMTGLTLTIIDKGAAAVEATFAFYEVPQNPGVPSGSYRLEGSYADGGLSLEGTEWIEQPEGYVMVGIESDPEITTRPKYLAGKVLDPSCTVFLLEKRS